MKKALVSTLILLISACSQDPVSTATAPNPINAIKSSTTEWLYLGQEPPGLMPIAFAPGLASTEHYEYQNSKQFWFGVQALKEII